MSGRSVVESLRALCRDIDLGRSPRALTLGSVLRPLAAPAVGLALAIAPGCGPMHAPYDRDEVCDNGVDDDSDGLVDCADPDCEDDAWCDPPPVALYGDVFEDCCNGADDDGDRLADCEDPDCTGMMSCLAIMYGVIFEDQCADGRDNDCNGLVDCDDPACASVCGMPEYGVPFEHDCCDGADGDDDGLVDCEDEDCADMSACWPTLAYGFPFSPVEENCSDGRDDDCDGFVDDEDDDCLAHDLYAAPFAN